MFDAETRNHDRMRLALSKLQVGVIVAHAHLDETASAATLAGDLEALEAYVTAFRRGVKALKRAELRAVCAHEDVWWRAAGGDGVCRACGATIPRVVARKDGA